MWANNIDQEKMKNRESQNQKVLKHLIKYRKIDGVTAWNKYGIMAVMRRIYDLRKKYEIDTKMVKSKSGSRYAVYVFKHETS